MLKKMLYKICFFVDEYALDLEKYRIFEITNEHTNSILNTDTFSIIENSDIEPIKKEILKKRISNKFEITYLINDSYGELMCFSNLSFKSTYDYSLNRNILIEENKEVLFFDDHVLEKFRGLGLHRISIENRLKISKKLNIKLARVNILRNNKSSKKNYIFFGFAKVNSFIAFNFYFFRFSFQISK